LTFCLKFNNFSDLSSFILKTGKVNFSYLLLVGAAKLQTSVKIQKLIENQESELLSCKVADLRSSPPPYTSPLQLLTKSSFWDSLLTVYFQKLHETFPIVSITHFNFETAPYSLLSAMYYYGYRFQSNQPEELTLYMENFAKMNLKSLIRECSLSTIQALLIYYSVYYFEGNVPMHIACRAHATRIAYALGLHLDNRMFNDFEKYTRRLVLCRVRFMNVSVASYQNLYPSFLTEFGIFDTNPFEPKWQTLNNSTYINYEDKNENYLYSTCTAHFINYLDEFQYNIYKHSMDNVKDSRFKSEWNRSRKAMVNLCDKYVKLFQSLYLDYPLYIQRIAKFEVQIKIRHHNFMMGLYNILKTRLGELSSSDIADALFHCNSVLKPVLLGKQFNFISQYLIFNVGYQYLNLYKLCSASDKQTIKAQLHNIIQIISTNYLPSTSLSFLILKNGYKSIINDNINNI
ncbi:hypothetical protein CONCODRAFT_5660, partial [Conidiobolus coronatus NRRL 28638]